MDFKFISLNWLITSIAIWISSNGVSFITLPQNDNGEWTEYNCDSKKFISLNWSAIESSNNEQN
jgi:hypothetical protein